MSYSECLSHTGLISVEKRRVRGDLIQVFKMLRSKDRVGFNNFLKIQSSNSTRGHNCRIVKQWSHLDIRKYFFSQRQSIDGIVCFKLLQMLIQLIHSRTDQMSLINISLMCNVTKLISKSFTDMSCNKIVINLVNYQQAIFI